MSESAFDHLCSAVTLYPGDCVDVLKAVADNSVDSLVSDPPYGLGREPDALDMLKAWIEGGHYDVRSSSGFMGKEWDAFVPQPAVWKEVYRVLKPGAFAVCFFGGRTYDLGVLAMRLAGFEVRDLVAWLYGSGFPKGVPLGKHIDALHLNGLADDDELARGPITHSAAYFDAFDIALKPAIEPIVLARKPLAESTVATNVLKWGTGALNIDGCRIGTGKDVPASASKTPNNIYGAGMTSLTGGTAGSGFNPTIGRWPANVVHDGSDEVVGAFPDRVVNKPSSRGEGGKHGRYGPIGAQKEMPSYDDSGSAARFFYTAKADDNDRVGSKHPTVKPVDLMRWLARLVTPPGGLVLDPFAGTGTTGEACMREGFRCILIEREAEYQADIRRRIKLAMAGPDERAREIVKAKAKGKPVDLGPLFSIGGAA